MRSGGNARIHLFCLEDCEGQQCHVALNLASCPDLAALAVVFPKQNAATGKTPTPPFAHLIPERRRGDEGGQSLLPGLGGQRPTTIMLGNETDFGAIASDILDVQAVPSAELSL